MPVRWANLQARLHGRRYARMKGRRVGRYRPEPGRSASAISEIHHASDSVISSSGSFDYDVVVLGAGAAGLVAAARAAECGARVVLVEKNRRAGVKILMSGGTRCNITNARGLRSVDVVCGPIDPAFDRTRVRGIRAIQQAFGDNGAFLVPALRRLDVDATIRIFEEAGVATKIEGNGKIFPVSDSATDVLDALLRRLERSGATLRCLCPALAVDPPDAAVGVGPGFAVKLPDETINARRVIVAVGGSSYPGCGTTGDGYAIARRFGHTVVDPRPALVPLRVSASWVPGLKGLSLHDVVASIYSAGNEMLQQRREAVLFAHFGLSGPAILDVSRAAARSDDSQPLVLHLDLVPDVAREELDQHLKDASRLGRPAVTSLLPADLPRRLIECLIGAADIPPDRMGPELTRQERQRLVTTLKSLSPPDRGNTRI